MSEDKKETVQKEEVPTFREAGPQPRPDANPPAPQVPNSIPGLQDCTIYLSVGQDGKLYNYNIGSGLWEVTDHNQQRQLLLAVGVPTFMANMLVPQPAKPMQNNFQQPVQPTQSNANPWPNSSPNTYNPSAPLGQNNQNQINQIQQALNNTNT